MEITWVVEIGCERGWGCRIVVRDFGGTRLSHWISGTGFVLGLAEHVFLWTEYLRQRAHDLGLCAGGLGATTWPIWIPPGSRRISPRRGPGRRRALRMGLGTCRATSFGAAGGGNAAEQQPRGLRAGARSGRRATRWTWRLRVIGFFVVRAAGDANGVQANARWAVHPGCDGTLVTMTGGMPVLDVNDRPIRLGPGAVQVGGEGSIMQRGREVGRISSSRSTRRTCCGRSTRASSWPTAGRSRERGSGNVKQFSVEDSSADEIVSLMRMTTAARDVEGNVSMIQAHDRLMDRAINGLGRCRKQTSETARMQRER